MFYVKITSPTLDKIFFCMKWHSVVPEWCDY